MRPVSSRSRTASSRHPPSPNRPTPSRQSPWSSIHTGSARVTGVVRKADGSPIAGASSGWSRARCAASTRTTRANTASSTDSRWRRSDHDRRGAPGFAYRARKIAFTPASRMLDAGLHARRRRSDHREGRRRRGPRRRRALRETLGGPRRRRNLGPARRSDCRTSDDGSFSFSMADEGSGPWTSHRAGTIGPGIRPGRARSEAVRPSLSCSAGGAGHAQIIAEVVDRGVESRSIRRLAISARPVRRTGDLPGR